MSDSNHSSISRSGKARGMPDPMDTRSIPLNEALEAFRTDKEINCFISRAWEDDPNHPNHVFTTKLAEDLRKVGINAQLDERGIPTGGHINTYVKQIEDENFFVITLFTPTYKQRSKIENSWISQEVNAIRKRLLSSKKFFYIPLLIEVKEGGNDGDSIPDDLLPREYLFRDFRKDYERNLIAILREKLWHPERLQEKHFQRYEDKRGKKFNCNGDTFPSLDSHYFVRRKEATTSKDYLDVIFDRFFSDSNRSALSMLVSLCALDGLGGVGKSTLAIAYALQFQSHYQEIYWVDASSEETLKAGFRRLLSVKDNVICSETVPLQDLCEIVINYFDGLSNYLIIYDNVSTENFLRHLGLFNLSNGGHILCTSRHRYWGNKIDVGVLTLNEAVDLLCKRSGVARDAESTTIEAAKELVHELGYLPLAITIAGSFIYQQNIVGCTITFAQYLKQFRQKHQQILLNFKIHDYDKSFITTWKITVDALGLKAKQFLASMSYLAPDLIPIGFFLGNLWNQIDAPPVRDESFEVSQNAINELVLYSMCERKDGFLSVHRMVQLVTRSNLESNQYGEFFSVETVFNDLLHFYYDFYGKDIDNARNAEVRTRSQFLNLFRNGNIFLPHILCIEDHLMHLKGRNVIPGDKLFIIQLQFGFFEELLRLSYYESFLLLVENPEADGSFFQGQENEMIDCLGLVQEILQLTNESFNKLLQSANEINGRTPSNFFELKTIISFLKDYHDEERSSLIRNLNKLIELEGDNTAIFVEIEKLRASRRNSVLCALIDLVEDNFDPSTLSGCIRALGSVDSVYIPKLQSVIQSFLHESMSSTAKAKIIKSFCRLPMSQLDSCVLFIKKLLLQIREISLVNEPENGTEFYSDAIIFGNPTLFREFLAMSLHSNEDILPSFQSTIDEIKEALKINPFFVNLFTRWLLQFDNKKVFDPLIAMFKTSENTKILNIISKLEDLQLKLLKECDRMKEENKRKRDELKMSLAQSIQQKKSRRIEATVINAVANTDFLYIESLPGIIPDLVKNGIVDFDQKCVISTLAMVSLEETPQLLSFLVPFLKTIQHPRFRMQLILLIIKLNFDYNILQDFYSNIGKFIGEQFEVISKTIDVLLGMENDGDVREVISLLNPLFSELSVKEFAVIKDILLRKLLVIGKSNTVAQVLSMEDLNENDQLFLTFYRNVDIIDTTELTEIQTAHRLLQPLIDFDCDQGFYARILAAFVKIHPSQRETAVRLILSYKQLPENENPLESLLGYEEERDLDSLLRSFAKVLIPDSLVFTGNSRQQRTLFGNDTTQSIEGASPVVLHNQLSATSVIKTCTYEIYNNLGIRYDMGDRLPLNAQSSSKWYEKALGSNNPDAYVNLALIYEGKEKAHHKAFSLLVEYQDRLDKRGLRHLGRMYALGYDKEDDFTDADHSSFSPNIDKAEELLLSCEHPSGYYNFGAMHYLLGNHELAYNYYQQGKDYFPTAKDYDKTISILNFPLGDEGLSALFSFLPERVPSYFLFSMNLTSNSMIALFQQEGLMHDLQDLDLSYNHIDDKFVDCIVQNHSNLKRLQRLTLNNNNISPFGAFRLWKCFCQNENQEKFMISMIDLRENRLIHDLSRKILGKLKVDAKIQFIVNSEETKPEGSGDTDQLQDKFQLEYAQKYVLRCIEAHQKVPSNYLDDLKRFSLIHQSANHYLGKIYFHGVGEYERGSNESLLQELFYLMQFNNRSQFETRTELIDLKTVIDYYDYEILPRSAFNEEEVQRLKGILQNLIKFYEATSALGIIDALNELQAFETLKTKRTEELYGLVCFCLSDECYEEKFSLAIRLYIMLADQGHPVSQNNLGFKYQTGKAIEKDLEKAIALQKAAAEQNEEFGLEGLGYCYEHGIGVEKNLSEALNCYTRSIGHNESLFNLAVCSRFGIGIETNDSEYLRYLKLAAQKDLEIAKTILKIRDHRLYSTTDILKDLEDQLIHLYRKAFNEEDEKSLLTLGDLSFYGPEFVKNRQTAFRCYSTAAKNCNILEAKYKLGMVYFEFGLGIRNGFRYSKKAILWIDRAAKLRHPKALSTLGRFYLRGECGLSRNVELAFDYFRQAAEQNDYDGLNRLAYCYENGIGVEVNPHLAIHYSKTAMLNEESNSNTFDELYSLENLNTAFTTFNGQDDEEEEQKEKGVNEGITMDTLRELLFGLNAPDSQMKEKAEPERRISDNQTSEQKEDKEIDDMGKMDEMLRRFLEIGFGVGGEKAEDHDDHSTKSGESNSNTQRFSEEQDRIKEDADQMSDKEGKGAQEHEKMENRDDSHEENENTGFEKDFEEYLTHILGIKRSDQTESTTQNKEDSDNTSDESEREVEKDAKEGEECPGKEDQNESQDEKNDQANEMLQQLLLFNFLSQMTNNHADKYGSK